MGLTSASIASSMQMHPAAYTKLRALVDTIHAHRPLFEAAFQKLVDHFPEAAFPPVWFIVGNQGPGGLTQQEGVIIALERFVDRPQDLD